MRKTALLLSLALLATAVVWASAAGGGSDPLASLSYLTGIFAEKVEESVSKKLDDSDEEILSQLEERPQRQTVASGWTEKRLKQNDVLLASTGTNVTVLAGEAYVSYFGGAVVDVTTGKVVPDGQQLEKNHRYMAAEDTSALVVVSSRTAVVDYQGPYDFQYSDAVDYNAMAAALKELHLFRGSFTGFGQGFDLEVAPTRIQALIMFIRVLGEEEEALAWEGSVPFKDIAPDSLSEKYVGYAYEKGYTNGYTTTAFMPTLPVSANQYTEFMLRALGYSSAANTSLADTLDRAVAAGLLTGSEKWMLESTDFLRADLVYISYYALDAAQANSGDTLSDALKDRGVFTSAELRQARRMVPGERLV